MFILGNNVTLCCIVTIGALWAWAGAGNAESAKYAVSVLDQKVASIDSTLKHTPQLYKKNILGNPNKPEEFYILNGDTAFVKIDGIPCLELSHEEMNGRLLNTF